MSLRPLGCKCKVLNIDQPVYMVSLAQHVVVTRAIWYVTAFLHIRHQQLSRQF